jgi:hypothetical protein
MRASGCSSLFGRSALPRHVEAQDMPADYAGVLARLGKTGDNTMTTDELTVHLLHDWGRGSAGQLARGVRATVDRLGQ